MNKQQWIKLAKTAVDVAIKNSEIVQPYVKPRHYRRALVSLNAIYWALNVADK